MPLRSLFIAGLTTLILVGGVSIFNFYVDPLCYNCLTINTTTRTVNHYYQVGQKILAHPKAQAIILGSSRGQTTSPLWVERLLNLQTLNLSMGAVELTAKLAFLNLADETLKLKEIVWWADFFELIPQTADNKIKMTPALQKYVETPLENHQSTNRFLQLLDHNTLEASFYSLQNPSQPVLDQGSGSDLNYNDCLKPEYRGTKTPRSLEKETGITYDTYTTKIFKFKQSDNAWQSFLKKLGALSERGLRLLIVVSPYHPQFRARLKAEYPQVYQDHLRWISNLESLKIPNVRFKSYFDGFPDDDGSPTYWNDGVHFTCKGVVKMLEPLLK